MKTHKIAQQTGFEDISVEYAAFVDKFKPKKTTDDCYTPENIYNAVADWAAKKYGFDRAQIVRPFWPGGDYQRFEYPDGCVVLDNPPFSILVKICRFYHANGIRFFLFAPALTPFSSTKNNTICAGASITYANGAVVSTSFVTNMGEYIVESAPELRDIIKGENDKNLKETKKELPKYKYPDCVITATAVNRLSAHHTHFKVRREDVVFVRALDAQRGTSGIFGGGFILSERAAEERAAAEQTAAENAAKERAAAFELERRGAICWELSEREKQLQQLMEKNDKQEKTT